MKRIKMHGAVRRLMALLLCIGMIASMIGGVGVIPTYAAAPGSGSTQGVIERVADPDTMDTYIDKLLTVTSGSRYAGRVWTDKTVFAYGAEENQGGVQGNTVNLDVDHDGLGGSVSFDADFLHVYSALASSQVVNEFPPTPIDLVIAFDMSASMGQDTRYSIDIDETTSSGGGHYQEHKASGDSWPENGVSMADRIENSRVQKTLDAINKTITDLMKQNPQNRVAVIGYGANATVLMPLAHWKLDEESETGDEVTQFLSVGGMETLFYPGDLKVNDDGSGWVWINNRDTCYTVQVVGNMNTSTEPLNKDTDWRPFSRVVSNNVEGRNPEDIKAFPGVETQTEESLADAAHTYTEESKKIQDQKSNFDDNARKERLPELVEGTKHLKADEYIGYYTNTQGGIYLAYKQLADSAATTYTEELSTGKPITVARVPAAIIMSDGGANFAFNPTGDPESQPQEYTEWKEYFGSYKEEGELSGDATDYKNDQTDQSREIDGKYRLRNGDKDGNIGDEWYNVWLPGEDTLGGFSDGGGEQKPKFKGVPSLHNPGADFYHNGVLASKPHWSNAGVLYSSDAELVGTSGTVLEVLLTASYMSTVVNKHYNNGWEKYNANLDSRKELSTYTMSVDTGNVPQWGRWRLYPTLNPKEYRLDDINATEDSWVNNASLLAKEYGAENFEGDDTLPKNYRKTLFDDLKKSWESIKDPDFVGEVQASMANNMNDKILIDKLPAGHIYEAGDGDNVNITQTDVNENIAYNDQFYDVSSGGIGGAFADILTEITGEVFVPVSGDNDAGVGDSITYQDPIGDYMEVKNQSITATPFHKKSDGTEGNALENAQATTYDMAMLLFGEMHGLTRTGVYDFQWNDNYMAATNSNGQGTAPMSTGWYKGDPVEKEDGSYSAECVENKTNEEIIQQYGTAEKAWADGWVFRLSFRELLQYVPITNPDATTPNDLTEQEKSTVYTIYRFSCVDDDQNELKMNPIYGDSVPDDVLTAWKDWYKQYGAYPDNNDIYKETKGVYRLNDIRVWVEEYGDYKDDEGSITPNSNVYDASLYVNIPAAAVPTQLVEVTLGKDGVLSYRANTDDPTRKDECTPLRLFYTVGLDEDLILRDENGTQVAVDVSSISEEYVNSHTTEDGNLYFISNYYSATNYDGYTTDSTSRTRGDPTVTFSSSQDNRYYLFQEPLPLFAHAYRVGEGGKLSAVDNQALQGITGDVWDENNGAGNGATDWEGEENGEKNHGLWDGGLFAGIYKDVNDFNAAYRDKIQDKNGNWTIKDSRGDTYTLPKDKDINDCIIFLETDRMDKVTLDANGQYETGSKSFSPDDWFFMVIDYYLPNGNPPRDKNGDLLTGDDARYVKGADTVHYVIARKGSEFGSGLHSAHISNGDMLCWTDINGRFRSDLKYNSNTDTGDRTRGEPTFEKLTYGSDELQGYLKDECGFVDGATLDAEVKYWLAAQEENQAALDAADEGEPGLTEDEFNAYFDFTLATKTGGVRTGDMAKNRGQKAENRTETAWNYYLPTLSANSGIGNNVLINNYLGNNGRLEITNQQLLVTKTLQPPEGVELAEGQENKEFFYQVYLAGATGERNAVKVEYNKYAKVWQRKMGVVDILTDNAGLLLNRDGQQVLFQDAGPVDGEDSVNGGKHKGSLVVSEMENGEPKYYIANEDGTKTDQEYTEGLEKLYYVYIPGNQAESGDGTPGARRIYQDEDWTADPMPDLQNSGRTTYIPQEEIPEDQPNDGSLQQATVERPAGSRSYWVSDAEMIPVTEVQGDNESEAESNGWRHKEHADATTHLSLNYLTVMVRKPPSGDVSGDTKIISPYSTRTEYLTQRLYFGHAMNNDGYGAANPGTVAEDGTITLGEPLTDVDIYDNNAVNPENPANPAYVAEFTLNTGEGLLFTGLSGQNYRFTEYLTQSDNETGYALQSVDQLSGGTVQTYTPESFQGTPGVYSVGGTINNTEDMVHYTNTVIPGDIAITKILISEDGTPLTEQELETEFSFTLELKRIANSQDPFPIEPPFQYTITGLGSGLDEVVKRGQLNPFNDSGAENVTDSNGVYAVAEDTWYFKLKPGQTLSVTGLPLNAEYTYTITEYAAYEAGYDVSHKVTSDKDYTVGYTATGTVKKDGDNPPAYVIFKNTRKVEPVNVNLPLTKSLLDKDSDIDNAYYEIEDDTYSFLVRPVAGNPPGDPVSPEGLTVEASPGAEAAVVWLFGNEGLEFTRVGTYKYTVQELSSNIPGVSIDGSTYIVTVNVEPVYVESMDGISSGQLKATVTAEKSGDPAGSLEFINTYSEREISAPLKAKKIYENGTLEPRQFEFQLKGISVEDVEVTTIAGETPPEPHYEPIPPQPQNAWEQWNDAYGIIDFGTITFTQPGVYTYELAEVPHDNDGIQYDGTVYRIRYTVTRVESPDGKGPLAVHADIQANGGKWVPWNYDPIGLVFTNKNQDTGSLTVTKTVTGENADRTKDWHFRVVLSDETINGTYGDMTFTDGVAEFTLKHGESRTATGLPAGVTYTVTEVEANQDGYETSSEGATGTIPADGSAHAEFANSIPDNPPPPPDDDHGNLRVTKTVTGSSADPNRSFHFRVELTPKYNGTYGSMTFHNGVAEFDLKDGESLTASGLPAGTTYTVTETDANQDGYTTSYSGETGTIPDGGTANADFVNSKSDNPPGNPPDNPPDDTTPPDEPTDTPSETPSEHPTDDEPETGDNSHMGFWIALMAISAVGFVLTVIPSFRRKKPYHNQDGKHLKK